MKSYLPGHFTQNPMVNNTHTQSVSGQLYRQNILPTPTGNVIYQVAVHPSYFPSTLPVQPQPFPVQPPHVVLSSIPNPYQHATSFRAAIPPPNQYQSPIEVRIIEQKPVEHRQSRAIPIIHPDSKKDVSKDIQQNVSSLRKDAPNFVPSTYKTLLANSVNTSSVDIPSDKNDKKQPIELNETVQNGIKDEFMFKNEEDPSITDSIKRIPSKLEQQLSGNEDKTNSVETIHQNHFNRQHFHSNFENNAPKRLDKQNNSHPYDNPCFPKYDKHNKSFPHPKHGHQKYQNANYYRNNENLKNSQNYNNENDLSYGKQSSNKSNLRGGYHQREKVDQECTVHFSKDNNIVSKNGQNMEVNDNSIYDMNNNEVKDQAADAVAEDSFMETTAENSENSLNFSRYTLTELNVLKKSPLVLSKPPTVRDDLLDNSLESCVWKTLFEKKFDDDSKILKKTNSTRYDNHPAQLSRSRSIPEKQMIKISLNEEVKLNEAENAWQPSHERRNSGDANREDQKSEVALLTKTFRSLLNKLTEENFERLIIEIGDKKRYPINTQEKLSAIVELLFEKSIAEPGFASTYAKLCREFSSVHVFDVENVALKSKSQNPWKNNLISRCQYEFERSHQDDNIFKNIQERIKNTKNSEEIETLEDCYFKIRQRANGTVKFIGELYKINMISSNIMESCIQGLLKSVTEENIERLCKLLTTIGEKLENELKLKYNQEKPKSFNMMSKYINDLEKLKDSNVITTQRIKFDIMNVIDLRKANWKQRENSRSTETKPQKLQQLQEQEDKKKKKQQIQLNEYNERQMNRSMQNGRGKPHQNRCDNDGFRMPTATRSFDMKKINIPKKNEQEMTLGPQKFLLAYLNGSGSQMAPPSTTISNSFANLLTDCDEPEELPPIHHTRSGSNKGNNRRDVRCNQNRANTTQYVKYVLNSKNLSPVRDATTICDDMDDDFFVELTEREESDKMFLMDKMSQILKGKATFDSLLSGAKNIIINGNNLSSVYNDLFDKKSNERMEYVKMLMDISKKGLITKRVNIDALKLFVKSIPSFICDVPYAYEYFSDYCVYYIKNGLFTLDEIKDVCQNQQNLLDKIQQMTEIKEESTNIQVSEPTELEESDIASVSQNDASNGKTERSLKNLMESIQFRLKKKLKNNYLEEIYSLIEKVDWRNVSNFIKDLTITLLRACFEKKGKKKAVDFHQVAPILMRYINNEPPSQMDCVNAIYDFVCNNSKNDGQQLCRIFDLFYDADIIPNETFKYWMKSSPTPEKSEAIKQASSFFLKLDEHDLSDDFNCTSSTIKD